MIEKVFIISFLVFAIHYTMKSGEIFGWLGDWFHKHLPDGFAQPVSECPVCMAKWYGTIIYWLVWGVTWKECVVVTIASVGLNAIITRIFPDEQYVEPDDPEEIKIHYGR